MRRLIGRLRELQYVKRTREIQVIIRKECEEREEREHEERERGCHIERARRGEEEPKVP
jgi:hypothetical protein